MQPVKEMTVDLGKPLLLGQGGEGQWVSRSCGCPQGRDHGAESMLPLCF